MSVVAQRVRTRRFAVVGSPVAHSRSPQIFAELARAAGVALTYDRVDIAAFQFGAVFARARATYDGWNVTAPHKLRAIAAADEVTPEAAAIGAANVITFAHGRALAANTDVAGVMALLTRAGAQTQGATASVLGAGGAARAAVLALAHAGAASVTVANRTAQHALALIEDLRDACGPTLLLAGDCDESSTILINATSAGEAVVGAVNTCAPGGWCVDLQYKPTPTPFVLAARNAGRMAIDGTYMLVAQAVATYRLWYGDFILEPPLEAALTAIVEAP